MEYRPFGSTSSEIDRRPRCSRRCPGAAPAIVQGRATLLLSPRRGTKPASAPNRRCHLRRAHCSQTKAIVPRERPPAPVGYPRKHGAGRCRATSAVLPVAKSRSRDESAPLRKPDSPSDSRLRRWFAAAGAETDASAAPAYVRTTIDDSGTSGAPAGRPGLAPRASHRPTSNKTRSMLGGQRLVIDGTLARIALGRSRSAHAPAAQPFSPAGLVVPSWSD